jgi:hypothetical protein
MSVYNSWGGKIVFKNKWYYLQVNYLITVHLPAILLALHLNRQNSLLPNLILNLLIHFLCMAQEKTFDGSSMQKSKCYPTFLLLLLFKGSAFMIGIHRTWLKVDEPFLIPLQMGRAGNYFSSLSLKNLLLVGMTMT